ncbi:MAG: DUF2306 domain-containing protein [Pararhodobacter sp.]
MIQIHAYSAILAVVLGAMVFLRTKGDRLHKATGRIWMASMSVVAISSFFITELRMFGPYSLIHLLSVFTIYALIEAIWMARKGNIRGHKRAVITLYGVALLLAGAFTLLPGRRMHAVLFADGGTSAVIAAALIAAGIGLVLFRRARSAPPAKPQGR